MGGGASCSLIMWPEKRLEEKAGTYNLFLRNLLEFMKATIFYEGRLRLAVSKWHNVLRNIKLLTIATLSERKGNNS